jgi:hypothetical protein
MISSGRSVREWERLRVAAGPSKDRRMRRVTLVGGGRTTLTYAVVNRVVL